ENKSLERLLREAKSIDPAVRDAAVRGIGSFGTEARSGLPTLTALLSDPDPGVAADGLIPLRGGWDGKERKVKSLWPLLVRVLQFGTPTGKVNAALALGQIGPDAKTAVKTLTEFTLKSTSWEVRKAGALALGTVAYEKKNGPEMTTVNALAKLVYDDKCAQVR